MTPEAILETLAAILAAATVAVLISLVGSGGAIPINWIGGQ